LDQSENPGRSDGQRRDAGRRDNKKGKRDYNHPISAEEANRDYGLNFRSDAKPTFKNDKKREVIDKNNTNLREIIDGESKGEE